MRDRKKPGEKKGTREHTILPSARHASPQARKPTCIDPWWVDTVGHYQISDTRDTPAIAEGQGPCLCLRPDHTNPYSTSISTSPNNKVQSLWSAAPAPICTGKGPVGCRSLLTAQYRSARISACIELTSQGRVPQSRHALSNATSSEKPSSRNLTADGSTWLADCNNGTMADQQTHIQIMQGMRGRHQF